MMRAWRLWIKATAALIIPAIALAIAGLAVQEALAGEPGLKLPPAAAPPITLPAPANPSAPAAPEEDDAPQFFLVPALALERIKQIIEAQRNEIERLRAIVNKGTCV